MDTGDVSAVNQAIKLEPEDFPRVDNIPAATDAADDCAEDDGPTSFQLVSLFPPMFVCIAVLLG